VVVEHPKGGLLRLPEEWTNRAILPLAPQVNGQGLRVDFVRLQKLHQMCFVALQGKLDSDHLAARITKSQKELQHNENSSDIVVNASEDAKGSDHRSVGDIGAQTASEYAK